MLIIALALGGGALACSNRTGGLDTGEATEADEADGGTGADGADGADGSDPDDGAEGPGGSGGADGGGSGGPDVPAACDASDTISAAFEVDDHDWPEAQELEIDVDVECEIVAMDDPDGQLIAPTLQCDVDGTMRQVTITMDDPGFQTPDGHPLLPDFGVGEAVRFRHTGVQNAGGLVDGADPQRSHYLLESFSLHRLDGQLLAAGFSDWGMSSELYAPVGITEDATACGELTDPSDPNLPILVTFTLDDVSLALVGGQAGLLDPYGFGDAGLGIVAEVADAVACCHTTREYEVLMVALSQGEG